MKKMQKILKNFDEEKYYRNTTQQCNFDNTLAQRMYKHDKKINIDLRNYFFQNFMIELRYLI